MKVPPCCLRSSILAFIFFFSLLVPSIVSAGQITLEWDPNTESDLAGYRLFHRVENQSYDYGSPAWTGTDNTCTLTELSETGVHYFVVRAFNTSNGESGDSNEVSLSFAANQPPISNAGPNQTVFEGDLVGMDGSKSSDPDDGIAYYLWSQTSGTAVTLSDLSIPSPTFTAPQVASGGETLTFQLTVTDYNGASASDSVNVFVNDTNDTTDPGAGAPIAVTDVSAASGKTYQVAQDLDNGSTCYIDRNFTYSNVPDFLKGAAFIQTSNSDKTQTDNPFLSFNVNGPTTVYVAFDDRVQLPSWMASFADTGFDLDTDVTFSIYEKEFPEGLIELGGNESDTSQCSMYTVFLVGNETAPVPNQPPAADAGADQTANELDVVLLDGSNSSDPDGDIAAYLWTQTAGTAVELSDSATAQPSFTCPEVSAGGETLTFQLTVTDHNGASASDSVNVFVNDTTDPGAGEPVAITDVSAASGKTYQVAQDLDNGSTCYIDRGFIYSNVPDFLKGAAFIQTSNSDKTRTNNPFLSFNVNGPATVYVAFDDRAQLPSWMASFADTGFNLDTDVTFSIYEREFPEGLIELGGNESDTSDCSMYTVFVQGN